MGAGTAWMIAGAFLLVALAGAVAAAIVLAARRHMLPPGGRDAHQVAGGDAAMDELRERYARGEIDEAELDQGLDRLLRH